MADGALLNRHWDDADMPRDESYREDTELARSTGRNAPQLYRDLRAAAESGWDFGSRWFADPKDDEFCLPGSGATPFDGDNEAGVQAFNSANAAPLPAP